MASQNFLPAGTFSNEQDAAQALLGEAVEVLAKQGVDFVVLGGWIPYLFNRGRYSHPGTFDVDVLLNENTSRILVNSAADALCRAGYLRAPKNAFQFHRLLNVGSRPMVFHVDFLHRRYAAEAEDIILQWGRMTSIAGPGTDVIFTQSERAIRTVTVPSVHDQAAASRVSIPFASEVGFLSAKGRSAVLQRELEMLMTSFWSSRIPKITSTWSSAAPGLSAMEFSGFPSSRSSKALLPALCIENAVKYLTSSMTETEAHVLVSSTVTKYFEDVYAAAPAHTLQVGT